MELRVSSSEAEIYRAGAEPVLSSETDDIVF